MFLRTNVTFILVLYYAVNVYGVVPPCRWTFSTSTLMRGDSTLTSADAECKARAAASTVPGIAANAADFVAWLSNDTHDALHRIGGETADCFQNAIGNRVATRYVSPWPPVQSGGELKRPTAEFMSGTLESSPFLWTEMAIAQEEDLFTFTSHTGMSSVMNCNNGESAGRQFQKGVIASKSARNIEWSMRSYTSCLYSKPIGCVQTPTPPPPASAGLARPLMNSCDGVAFVSSYRYYGYQLSDPDAMNEACRAEARNSVYVYNFRWQDYRAIYTMSGRTAASMLSSTFCIGNLLGRPFWKRASSLSSFTFVETPRLSTGGFIVVGVDDFVWTGSSPDLQTPMATCTDWTDMNAGGGGRALNVFGRDVQKSCTTAHHLLCVRAPNDYQGPNVESLLADARIVFTTNDVVTGNMGGLEEADILCQNEASDSILDPVVERADRFIAYLSTERMDAAARLIDLGASLDNKSYVSSTGAPLFNSFDPFLLTNPPRSAYLQDADGIGFFGRLTYTSAVSLLTATSPGGRYNSGGDCEGWWSADNTLYTTYSQAAVDRPDGWLHVSRSSCSSYRHLLCVEVETAPKPAHYTVELKLDTPSPCLYMFRTNEKFSTTFQNLEALDDVCQYWASNSSITGVAANAHHFIGLISNSTVSFRMRLQERRGSVNCWKNTLERLVIAPAGNIFGGNDEFFGGFWPDANGHVEFTSNGPFPLGTFMLTGTKEDGTGDINNCENWSGPQQAMVTNGFEMSNDYHVEACNSVNYFACVQANIGPAATSPPTVAPTFPIFLPPTEGPPTFVLTQSTEMASTMDLATSATELKSAVVGSTPTTAHPATSSSSTTANAETDASTTPNPVDNMVSEPFDLLIPVIAGVGAFVLLLVCVVLLCVVMRRRRGGRRHDSNMDGDARSHRGSYHGAHTRSDMHRSRMKTAQGVSGASQSKASRRSRSRRSARLSAKLSTSPWSNGDLAPFNQSLPTLKGGEYQRMPTLDASVVYTAIGLGPKSAASAGRGAEYMDIAGPYGTMVSVDSTSTYQELRVPREAPILSYDAVPSGFSPAESTSAAYGLMPSSTRFDERNGDEYEYVEMSRMAAEKEVVGQCRYAFVTSSLHGGDTPIESADAICMARAALSSVPGIQSALSWVAWLSNDTHDALWRAGGHSGDCFQNANGQTVASSTSELTSGYLQAPIWSHTETLNTPTASIWTHTTISGVSSMMNCNNQGGSYVIYNRGNVGAKTATTLQWTMDSYQQCSSQRHLGCIEVAAAPTPASEGLAYPLPAPCDAVAFISGLEFRGSDLVDSNAMDEQCRREAANSEYHYGDGWQHYRAIYTSATRTTADMLASTLCIGSLIGRPFWARTMTGIPFNLIEIPMISGDAATLLSDQTTNIWTGSKPDLWTASKTCQYWTNSSADARALNINGDDIQRYCNGDARLLCVKAPNDFQGPSTESLVNNKRIVFVRKAPSLGSIVFGDREGLEQADYECQIAAATSTRSYISSRAARFIAYLSTRGVDAVARLNALSPSKSAVPYVSSHGAPLYDSMSDFYLPQPPQSTYFRDENGEPFFDRLENHARVTTWSSTAPGGRYSGAGDCGEWKNSSFTYGTYGTTGQWLLTARSNCVALRHLICVEVEQTPDAAHYTQDFLLDTPSPCMYVFRTSVKLSPNFGALENLDATCQSLAAASRIPGIAAMAPYFIGVVGNSSISFRERLESRMGVNSCWKNTVERLVTSGGSAGGPLYAGGAFLSGVWADENGNDTDTSVNIVTGIDEDGSLNIYNCDDWTGTDRATSSSGFELTNRFSFTQCNVQSYFMCIQTTMEPLAATPTTTPTKEPTRSPDIIPTRSPTSMPTSAQVTTAVSESTTTFDDVGGAPTTSTVASASSTALASDPSATSSSAGTSEMIIDDTSSDSANLVLPLMVAVGVLVLLLLCSIVMNFYFRRRAKRRQQSDADEVVRTRRGEGSYYGGGHGGNLRRSRMKTNQNSGASRRSRSRRSQRLSTKLVSSPFAFDHSLPVAVGDSEYQHISKLGPASIYDSTGFGFSDTNYVELSSRAPGYDSVSQGGSGSNSTYQELRVPKNSPPLLSYDALPSPGRGGASKGSGSAPYGNIPASTRFEDEEGGDYVEMSKMDIEEE